MLLLCANTLAQMARKPRRAIADIPYHVLNRAVARMTLFETFGDYAAFERTLRSALERTPVRLLSFCLMPTHWHLVVWPRQDGQLTDFVRWLTHTHAMRWHTHHGTMGTGHLYQARFKAFPIQDDGHFLTVCRYVERNALRARLVREAHLWRWSSLWWRTYASSASDWLADWPVPRPSDWLRYVHQPLTAAEIEAVRNSVRRGTPYGSPAWQLRTAQALSLEHTLRKPGRPPKVRK